MSIRSRVASRLVSYRTVRVASAASLLLLAACAGGASDDPGSTSTSASALASDAWAWGFAWVNPPYAVDPGYSFNSASTVANTYSGANGDYVVTMDNLGVSGGTVQVVAYGSSNVRCKVAGWGPSGTAMNIHVLCHAPSGALAASPFVVFFDKGAPGQTGAYAYYSGGSVPSTWSWNSSGGTNSVSPTSTGHYLVSLPGMTFSNASVHVTAYGSDASYCKIVSWGAGTGGATVSVRCNDTNGNPANSPFVIGYGPTTLRDGMVGGHAWISDATTAPAGYQREQNVIACFSAAPITVTGFSDVDYPDIYYAGIPTTTMATAYGDDGAYCKVGYWFASGTGYTVHNTCFTAQGAPTTARFTSSFLGGSYPGPC